MIAELARRLPNFSVVNHTRCFLHITNLVAQSIVKQFDVKKVDADGQLNAAELELQEVADGLELEEALAAAKRGGGEGDAGNEVDDNDGWVDEVALLTDKERAALEISIRPVKLVLAKVSVNHAQKAESHLVSWSPSFAKSLSKSSTPARCWVLHGGSVS